MFENILIYIDQNLTHSSLAACAANIAGKYKSKVSLIGTIYPLDERLRQSISPKTYKEINDEKRAAVKTALDNFAEQLLLEDITAETTINIGTPFIEISKQVMHNEHDLVMLLSDDHQSGLSKAFFGSTQMHLLRKCPCAVWVVKPETKAIAKNILAPIDIEFVDEKEENLNHTIVTTARAMAQIGKSAVTFMHVWSLYGEGFLLGRGYMSMKEIKQLRKERKKNLKEKLDDLVKVDDWEGLDLNLRVPRSEIASIKIINAVEKHNIDLLVMGTLCRTGIAGFVIGNTAEKILNEVSCSVLAIKPAGFVSPIKLKTD